MALLPGQKRIIDYKILSSKDNFDLCDQINKLIKSNWQPLGGICSAINNNSGILLQAMVKYNY